MVTEAALAGTPITILFLIDAWRAGTGGIETVNRELCLALARTGREYLEDNLKVVCLAAECTDQDIAEASAREVMLLKSEGIERAEDDPRIVTLMSHSVFDRLSGVACVVGHSKFTGKAALSVRDRYFSGAKVVTVYHMDPDEIEIFKEGSPESEDRSELERDIAAAADIPLAIGPLLTRRLEQLLYGLPGPARKVHTLLCGLREDVVPREALPPHFSFLFSGRVEHSALKGVDLFARAAARFAKEIKERGQIPTFVIRGFPPKTEASSALFQQILREAQEEGQRQLLITRQTFTPDEAEICRDIRAASVLVMPSRAEGFGLVALEAINRGTAAIVPEHSGVAEVIRGLYPEYFPAPKFVVDTLDDPKKAVNALAKAMEFFWEKPDRITLVTEHLRSELMKTCSWSAAATKFLECTIGTPSGPSTLSADRRTEVQALLSQEHFYVNERLKPTSIFLARKLTQVEQTFSPRGSSTSIGSSGPEASLGEERSWSEVVAQEGGAVILGTAGIGKTTLLLREVSQRCLNGVTAITHGQALDDFAPAFYFHANQLAGELVKANGTVLKAILRLLSKRHGPIGRAVQIWIRDRFKAGRLLLVIDALDEVVPASIDLVDRRKVLLDRLTALGRADNPCPLLISSRFSGYSGSTLPSAPEWLVQPLTLRHIKSAIRQRLAEYPAAIKDLEELLAPTSPPVNVLSNPLLLMVACGIWEGALNRGHPLPTISRRCELYQQFISTLHARWIERLTAQGRPPTTEVRGAYTDFIPMLAWKLWSDDPRRTAFAGGEIVSVIETISKPKVLAQRDLLDDLCEAGFLSKVNYDYGAPYIFLHRSLLEYLSALHIAHRTLDPASEVVKYLGNPDTAAMFWMLTGNLYEPSSFLARLVSWAEVQTTEAYGTQGVVRPITVTELIIDCVSESRSGTLPGDIRLRAWEIITRGLDRNQRRQRQGGGEWAGLADWRLGFRALQAIEVHEGQRSRVEDLSELLDYMRGGRHSVENLQEWVERLGFALRSPAPVARWLAIWAGVALFSKGIESSRRSLCSYVEKAMKEDDSPYVRSLAVRALAQLSEFETVPILAEALYLGDPVIAGAAANALSRIATPNILIILKQRASTLLDAEACNVWHGEDVGFSDELSGDQRDSASLLVWSSAPWTRR